MLLVSIGDIGAEIDILPHTVGRNVGLEYQLKLVLGGELVQELKHLNVVQWLLAGLLLVGGGWTGACSNCCCGNCLLWGKLALGLEEGNTFIEIDH